MFSKQSAKGRILSALLDAFDRANRLQKEKYFALPWSAHAIWQAYHDRSVFVDRIINRLAPSENRYPVRDYGEHANPVRIRTLATLVQREGYAKAHDRIIEARALGSMAGIS